MCSIVTPTTKQLYFCQPRAAREVKRN
jgi:hypothetical protein